MIRDYAGHSSSLGRQQARSGRRGGEMGASLNRAVGVVLATLTLAAVGSGFWVAWAVRSGLDEMACQQQQRQELLQRHRELGEQRHQLLARERIEEEAARLGLFPPRPGQVRPL